jgi:hypothetical protein
LADHDYDEAERALAASTRSDFQDVDFSFAYPRSWYAAIIARARGDKEKARLAFTEARVVLEERFKAAPTARTRAVLAQVYAGLGLKELAITEVETPADRFPISRDGYNGPIILQSLAQVAAWTGDKPRAIEAIKVLLSHPGYLSYGFLLKDPAWAPLRDDPQFQAVVRSQAPVDKNIAKNLFSSGGRQDDVLSALSKFSDLKVVSRPSAASNVVDPPRNSPPTADTSVSGLATNSTATKTKKEGRNLVWIRPKLGSNLPGHWAAADSPEAKEAMTQGTISRQSLQDRQNQGVGIPIAPPAITSH